MNSKFILVALLLTTLLTKLYAQEMKWGVKAGYNMSTFKSDIDGEKYLPGYHFGATLEIKVSEKLSAQPELFYSLEGAKLKIEEFLDVNNGFSIDSKLKLGYIQLPIMLKYYAFDKFSVELGPQIGYLITAKNDYTSTIALNGITATESDTEDVKSDFKSINLALKFGLGYELKNKMFFQARYTYGASDINKNSDDEKAINTKATNQGLQFSVGYKF